MANPKPPIKRAIKAMERYHWLRAESGHVDKSINGHCERTTPEAIKELVASAGWTPDADAGSDSILYTTTDGSRVHLPLDPTHPYYGACIRAMLSVYRRTADTGLHDDTCIHEQFVLTPDITALMLDCLETVREQHSCAQTFIDQLHTTGDKPRIEVDVNDRRALDSALEDAYQRATVECKTDLSDRIHELRDAIWSRTLRCAAQSLVKLDADELLSRILGRWYRGARHVTRARMLIYNTKDTCTKLDIDANWEAAVINFAAAVDQWNKLPDTQHFRGFDKYRGHRNSLAHICTDGATTFDERGSMFETLDGHRGVLVIRSTRYDFTDQSRQHPRDAGRYSPDSDRGFSVAMTPELVAGIDFDLLYMTWRKMRWFYNDYLSRRSGFNIALRNLRSQVSHDDDDPSFSKHVFEHHELISECDYCMVAQLERSLQILSDA